MALAAGKNHRPYRLRSEPTIVRDAKEAYDDLPELLPRFIDVDDYLNDLGMLMALRPFMAMVMALRLMALSGPSWQW